MKKLAAILLLTSALAAFGQTIGVNRTTGETLDAGLKYNMATARFDLTNQTASGSSTNLAIDARYREHFVTAGTSFRFYLTNAVESASKVEQVFITVTNSSGSTIYATNVVDTLESVGNWGTIYAGKNTLALTYVNGLWEVRQDTAKIAQSQVEGLEDALALKADASDLDAKQDALTEGDGISIENGVISATVSSSGESVFDATTNNVPIPLYTNTLATGTSGGYSAIVLGGGPTNIYSFDVRGLVSNPDGTAVLIASELISSHPEGGTNITAYWDASGTDAVLYVRGYEAENVNWRAVNISALVVTNGEPTVVESGTSYLLEENFEDSLDAWTTVTGSATLSTEQAAEGTQSLKLVRSGSPDQSIKSATWSSAATTYGYAQIYVPANPSTSMTLFRMRNAGSGGVSIRVTLNGNLNMAHNTINESTPDPIPLNEWVHVWWSYTPSSGANDGLGTIAFSTDGTKPTSGTAFKSIANGNSTTSVNELNCEVGLADNTVYFDRIRIDDEEIGSNPE